VKHTREVFVEKYARGCKSSYFKLLMLSYIDYLVLLSYHNGK